MIHEEIAPPKHLAKYIRFFWTLEYSSLATSDSTFKVFARKYPRMVFQHNNGKPGIYDKNGYLPLAYLSGINSLPYDCGIQSSISTLGVSFYPHAIKPIFGIDACDLDNELPDITNFVPRSLVDQLIETASRQEKITLLCDFFTRQLHHNRHNDKVCEMAWKFLLKGTNEIEVRRLTHIFNLSERQLERRFKYSIGFTPKQFLKINRFEKAVKLLQSPTSSKLSNLAYELSYTDQSHFIREFKQFSNITPTQYLKLQKVYEENSAFIVKENASR